MKSIQWNWKLFYRKDSIRNVLFKKILLLADKINKNSKSTESSWSDDHVSISSSDYQTSSKINKTETSKSSDDLEKDHGNNSITS